MSSCDHVSEEVLLPEWVLAIANLLRGSWELLASLEVGGVGLQLGQRLLRLRLVLRRGGRERLQLCALGQLLCDEARERVRAGLLLLLLLLGWLEGRRPVEARALWRSGGLPKRREPTGQRCLLTSPWALGQLRRLGSEGLLVQLLLESELLML